MRALVLGLGLIGLTVAGVSLSGMVRAASSQGGVLRADVAASQDPLYQAECGSCHLAFPPGLLPARSWEKLLHGLERHFGDNAELNQETLEKLRTHLTGLAADRVSQKRSRKIAASIPSRESPIRITEIGYFVKEHREIPSRVRQDPKIGSMSRCEGCHPNANRGSFHEEEIVIPQGAWRPD